VSIGKIWTKSELDADLKAFDWSFINSLSEEELEARAKADPNYFEPSDEALAFAIKTRDARSKQARAS
jgi:hypothetical protein